MAIENQNTILSVVLADYDMSCNTHLQLMYKGVFTNVHMHPIPKFVYQFIIFILAFFCPKLMVYLLYTVKDF